MPTTSAGAVSLDLKANTKQFEQDAESAAGRVKGIFGKAAAAIGAAMTIDALVDFGKQCTEIASALTEVQNVVDQVFPNMGSRVDAWSSDLVESFGLSELSAKRYASTVGSMARSMGFTEEQAYELGTSIAELSGDIASFYDMSSDEAYEKLTAIFTGVTQPLRSLGINMTEASLEAFALSRGIQKSYQEMSEAERTMLRYQFVLDRTRFAAGDFERTNDSWANQLRILNMHFQELQATLGEGLIAALLPAIEAIDALIVHMNTAAQAAGSMWASITNSKIGRFIGGLFGQTSKNVGGLSKNTSKLAMNATDAAESTNELTAAQTGAAGAAGSQGKAVEKLNRTLAGFDRINKLTANSTSGSGGSGGGGGGGGIGGLGDLSSLLDIPKELGGGVKSEVKKGMSEGLQEGLFERNPLGYIGRKVRTSLSKALGIDTKKLQKQLNSKFSSGKGGGGGFSELSFIQRVARDVKTAFANKDDLKALGSLKNGGGMAFGGGGAFANFITAAKTARNLVDGIRSKTVTITGKVSGANIDGFKKTYDGLKTKSLTLDVKGNASTELDGVNGKLSQFKSKTIVLDADDDASPKTDGANQKLAAFKSKTVTLDAADAASSKAVSIKGKIDELNGKTVELGVKDNASKGLDTANGKLAQFASKAITLSETDNASGKTDAAVKKLADFKDKSIKLDATYGATAADVKSGWKSRIDDNWKGKDAKLGYEFTNTAAAWKKQWDERTDVFYDKHAKVTYDFTNTWQAWRKQWDERLTAFPDHTAKITYDVQKKGINGVELSQYTSGGKTTYYAKAFAQGGFVERNTPQLAIIGDNKREGEIVSPESKFQTMLDKAAGTGGNAETVRLLGAILSAVQSIDPSVSIDGREVTRTVVNNINRQVQSTGRSPLLV